MENIEIKLCSYRNCDNSLEFKRSDSKYCCRNHKNYEKEYRKTDIVFIDDEGDLDRIKSFYKGEMDI